MGFRSDGFTQTTTEEWDFGPNGCATGFGLSFLNTTAGLLELLMIEAETDMTLLTVPDCEPIEVVDITKTFTFHVSEAGSRIETIIEDSS